MIRAAGIRRNDATALGFVLLLGAALSWFSAFHPAAMPAWGPWQFSWVEYLGSVLGLFWYGSGIVRMGPQARPAPWRQACYGLGIIAIYAMVQTKFTYVALHLFMATQSQQFVLHDLGPFLVALSWPGAVLKEGMPAWLFRRLQARPVLRLLGIVQQPAVAAFLFILLLVLQVVPAVVFRVMLDGRLFDAMNIVMAVDGVLFWCLVLDPRPQPPAPISFLTRMALAFVVMVPVMPIGAYIAFTSRTLYEYYELCGQIFPSISLLRDQHMGGLILWIPGGLMSAAAILLPLNAMRLAEEHAERHGKVLVQVGQRQIDASAWTGR